MSDEMIKELKDIAMQSVGRQGITQHREPLKLPPEFHQGEIAPNANLRQADMVNHPPHYTSHPSGVECIEITEYMSFCIGNAVKYLWRADEKGNAIQDLEKARWYIDREIAKRTRGL